MAPVADAVTRGLDSAQASPAGRWGSAQRPLRAGVTGAARRAVRRKHRRRRRMEAEPERAEAQRRGRIAGVSGPRLRRGRSVARAASWPVTVAGRERPPGGRGGSQSLRVGAPGSLTAVRSHTSWTSAAERGWGLGSGLVAPHRAEAGKLCRPSPGRPARSPGTTAVLDFCGTPWSEKG